MTLDEFLAKNPEPCAWPRPVARVIDGAGVVLWESLGGDPPSPDEADAIAAMLIRAAAEARSLEAKGE